MPVGARVRLVSAAAAALLSAWGVEAPVWASDLPIATRAAYAQSESSTPLDPRDAEIAALRARLEALERRVAGMDAAQIAPPPAADVAGADSALLERALERTLTRTGALLLPAGFVEIDPTLIYRRSESTNAALAQTPLGLALGESNFERDEEVLDVQVRAGLPFGSQIELGAGIAAAQEDVVTNFPGAPPFKASDDGVALSDLRIGLAKTLAREGVWRPDLIGRLTWDTATGDEQDGAVFFGNGFHEVDASLTAIKRQDPLVFVLGVGYRRAFEEGDVKPGDQVSVAGSAVLAVSPETSLRLGVRHASVDEAEIGGVSIAGSDRNAASLTLGGSSILGRNLFLDLSIEAGLTDSAPDYSVLLSLPVRFRARNMRGRGR